MTLYIICVVLHILAVVLWIGHMFFWSLIVGPITKRFEPKENREVVRDVSLRRGGLGWPCLVILIITGIYILSYRGVTISVIVSGAFFQTPYGYLISTKILLVFAMVAYQTFVGHRPAPKLVYANMLAALLIIALSIILVRFVTVGNTYWEFKYPEPFLESSHLNKRDTIQRLGTVKLVIISPDFEKIISKDAHLEQLATGCQFTEGPIWNDREGYLLFSDIPANKIYKWTAETGVSVFRSPSGKSNGLTLDASERLIAAEHQNRRVSRTEEDGKIVTLASHYKGKRLNSPNDVVVRSDGSVYFTDPSFGSTKARELDFQGVYRLSPDGKTLSLLLNDFDGPNGLAFSVDEKTLYVSDQNRKHVRAFDVREDGTLTNSRIFAQFYVENGGPDGIKVDLHDNVYITVPAGISVWDKEGKELGIILIREFVANMNWGDSDRKTLYITANTSLYRVRLNVPGP